MSCEQDSTAAAPAVCWLCGQPEHGSATCNLPTLVAKGMDDIAAGRVRPACFGRMDEAQKLRSCESDEVHYLWIWACARENLAKPLVECHNAETRERTDGNRDSLPDQVVS